MHALFWKAGTDGFDGKFIELGSYDLPPSAGYMDLTLEILPSETGYEYSKLYFSCQPEQPYDEDRVICFRVIRVAWRETHRLVLPPDAINSEYIRLRLDALPYTRGTAAVDSRVRFVPAEDQSEQSQRARRRDLKQRTRAGVEESENRRREWLPHMPESISLELTAGCNLTCSHCSSHGTAEAHRMNNRRKAFDMDMLDRLAEDTFPSLTLVNLVGRGEPMMVGLPLWQRLISHLLTYDVFMTCVTNATFLTKRIDEAILPVVDTLTASIDGTTPEIFAANRGGASLENWRRNIDHFNSLRKKSGLARLPRLGLSWTLKRNNIHQFPDFIRLAIELEADLLYVRHLFVFHEKDRGESLVCEPELTNRYLNEGYAMLEGKSIKLDAVPLAATSG